MFGSTSGVAGAGREPAAAFNARLARLAARVGACERGVADIQRSFVLFTSDVNRQFAGILEALKQLPSAAAQQ